MSQKKILLIGGTGFLGSHLANHLVFKNFKVTSLSSNLPTKDRRVKKVKYLIANILNKKKLKKINDTYNFVVNLSGYIDHSNKKMTFKTHYNGCVNLLKKFQKANIEKFIQIGSSLEYGNLNSPHFESQSTKKKLKSVYSNSKLLATNFLLKKYKENNFPAVIVRLYQVYGPTQKGKRLIPFVIQNCLKNKTFNCSEGSQFRDFLYVDDFVRAIYKIIIKKNLNGQIINIGYGKPEKVRNVINQICQMIQKGVPKFGTFKLRKDESRMFYPSILKARRILNWKPKIKLRSGLIKTINTFKNYK